MTTYKPKPLYYAKVQDHLSLGELISILERLPREALIHSQGNRHYPLLVLHSYRGYPEDIEWESSENPVTVGEFLDLLNNSKGIMLEAWKGGEYRVSEKAYLWVGIEGTANQQAVTGVGIRPDGTYSLLSEFVEYR